MSGARDDNVGVNLTVYLVVKGGDVVDDGATLVSIARHDRALNPF